MVVSHHNGNGHRHGVTNTTRPLAALLSASRRLAQSVERGDATACWTWTRDLHPSCWARISVGGRAKRGGRTMSAARVAWLLWSGHPLPAFAPLVYMDNGDGTITDVNTGLMWEKKSQDGGVHDVGTRRSSSTRR
jgi:hypothetical protein